MRTAPESVHRQPPESSHREPVKFADDPPPPAEVGVGGWVHYGGGWYENLETGEKRHGRPEG